MKEREKEKIISRYSDRLKEHGVSSKTLGWDKNRHNLRYHILLSNWSFKGDNVLDFGCGFADMYSYISTKKMNLEYSGVDINPDLINEGKKLYPKLDLKADDFLQNNDEEYDYILSSGVHNFKLEDTWGFTEKSFEVFSKSARKGFAVNFISDQVDEEFKKEHLFYTSPVKVLELAYKYSRRVVLRNDYMPFEFTVFVNLEDDFDKQKVVYPEFLSECK